MWWLQDESWRGIGKSCEDKSVLVARGRICEATVMWNLQGVIVWGQSDVLAARKVTEKSGRSCEVRVMSWLRGDRARYTFVSSMAVIGWHVRPQWCAGWQVNHERRKIISAADVQGESWERQRGQVRLEWCVNCNVADHVRLGRYVGCRGKTWEGRKVMQGHSSVLLARGIMEQGEVQVISL